uniref:Uncharacterized protein n=1 Tax=Panagrellus redivivus TaxID=6233 RepID=A0A7E4VPC4_PANRE
MRLKFDRNKLRKEEFRYSEASLAARTRMEEAFANATEVLECLARMEFPVKPMTMNKLTSTYPRKKINEETSTDDLEVLTAKKEVETVAPMPTPAPTPPQEAPLSRPRRRGWDVAPMTDDAAVSGFVMTPRPASLFLDGGGRNSDDFTLPSSPKRPRYAAPIDGFQSPQRFFTETYHKPIPTPTLKAPPTFESTLNVTHASIRPTPRPSTDVATSPTQPTTARLVSENAPNRRDSNESASSSSFDTTLLQQHFDNLPTVQNLLPMPPATDLNTLNALLPYYLSFCAHVSNIIKVTNTAERDALLNAPEYQFNPMDTVKPTRRSSDNRR